uniref:E2 ubiquitin-conjugating enzyme n=1 Tax=Acrobeloides nanus TaxID=290746 RepID=A0A914BVF8_9BILA
MSNIFQVRLTREIADVTTSEDLINIGILVSLIDEKNVSQLEAQIAGPPETSYEGGKFKLSIDVPKDYPFKPPDVKFTTKVWHPNVSSKTGVICLDILKEQWAASMTLRSVLLSVQQMLCNPEPKNPQDAVVAKQYMKDINLFNETAKFWTQVYANAPGFKNEEMSTKVQKLTQDMGYNENTALTSLSYHDWDINKAIEDLAS